MKKVITLKNPVAITAFSCVGGKKEGDGPLSAGFDEICRDDYFGMKSWEKAETEMQKRSIRRLFSKRNINENDVSVAIGGDLCDQITSTAFAYRDISMPFLGQYTACATMAQSLAVGSVLVSRGAVANALVGASSHFCTAERQFRTPLDYANSHCSMDGYRVGSRIFGACGKRAFYHICQFWANCGFRSYRRQ